MSASARLKAVLIFFFVTARCEAMAQAPLQANVRVSLCLRASKPCTLLLAEKKLFSCGVLQFCANMRSPVPLRNLCILACSELPTPFPGISPQVCKRILDPRAHFFASGTAHLDRAKNNQITSSHVPADRPVVASTVPNVSHNG